MAGPAKADDKTGRWKKTSVILSVAMHRRLKVAAAETGREMGELLDEALHAYFEKHRSTRHD